MDPIQAVPSAAWAWQDSLTLGLFFAGLVAVILWVLRQKEETTQDYFLAGRDAGWLAIGSSIFASNIGSEHLVGLAGAGATSGMAMAHWEMHGWLILILGWVFVRWFSQTRSASEVVSAVSRAGGPAPWRGYLSNAGTGHRVVDSETIIGLGFGRITTACLNTAESRPATYAAHWPAAT